MRHRTHAGGPAKAVLVLLVLPLAGCDAIAKATSPEVTAQEYLFNFENSLSGWSTTGSNVDPDGSHWSIAASEGASAAGAQAVAFRLDSREDDSRIWMEREFLLRSDMTYDVTFDFEFASADWGPGEHWNLMVAAGTGGPLDLGTDAFYAASTANGAVVSDGFRWRSVKLPTSIRTGADGRARIAIGIEGRGDRDATYYLDELGVKFSLK